MTVYWPETITRWQREGLNGDAETVLRQLKSDIADICSTWPVPYPGREEVLSETAETKVVRGPEGKTVRVWLDHTDGDVRKLLDLFVEAGFDCLQPLEAKAGMDVRQLAPKYGRQLSFFGNIDMTVAIRGDRDELEHEIRSKLAAGMATRGYAYHSDHNVPPQVSWATYQFILDCVEKYGRYP